MQENQTHSPFEWLDKVINSLNGCKKVTASIDEIRAVLEEFEVNSDDVNQIIEKLETSCVSGKNSRFCEILNVKPPAPYDWRARNKIPEKRVPQIVSIASDNDLKVLKHNLRPDIWDENDERIKGEG